MLPAKSIWSIHEVEETEIERLAEQTGLHPIAAKLLLIRGIEQPDEAMKFLQAGPESLHNPYLMSGMQSAVDRINEAIEKKQFIRIYGDYDADGVSSTAIMVRLFRRLGARFDYYIPHRTKEGYGLNRQAIDDAKNSGVSLIVTVDNGISAREEIAYARSLEIDVIVTDHHEPPELLPDQAAACVNPRQPGCQYPFKALAGAGVAWKLAYALYGEMLDELTEIAAIGTIADLMPMLDENRTIVTDGLKQMQTTRIPGLKAIFERAGLTGKAIDETDIGFTVGPRINAAGRMAHADIALKLLITDDMDEAESLAEELDQLNRQRQTVVDKLTKEALEQAESEYADDRVIVLSGENWHVGVVGIVASRLMDRWYRPIVVLSIDPETGMAKGSARSIDGYDIHKALTACDDLLEHYGGHQAAGGMSLKEDNIEAFRKRLNELADEWLEPEHFVPKSEADAVCSIEDASLDTIKEISKLAPFGIGNPAPRFVFKQLKTTQLRRLGKTGKHLKISLTPTDPAEKQTNIDALAFGLADLDQWMTPWANINIYGELSINEWNGKRSPQIRVMELSIDERQVFDWRGVKNGAAEWEKWLQAGKLSGDKMQPVVIGNVTSEQLDAMGMKAACYTYDELEQESINDSVSSVIGSATDLIIYSLPRNIEQMKTALKRLLNVRRIIVWLHEEEPYSQLLPTRDQFKQVYVRLKQEAPIELHNASNLQRLSRQSGVSPEMIQFIISVFDELEFVQLSGSKVDIHPSPSKKELHTSIKYQRRKEQQELKQFLLHSTGRELAVWLLRQLPEAGSGPHEAHRSTAYESIS